MILTLITVNCIILGLYNPLQEMDQGRNVVRTQLHLPTCRCFPITAPFHKMHALLPLCPELTPPPPPPRQIISGSESFFVAAFTLEMVIKVRIKRR